MEDLKLKSKSIKVRCTPSQHTDFKNIAERQKLNMSELLRDILKEFLKKHKK